MKNLLDDSWQIVDINDQTPRDFSEFNLPNQLQKSLSELGFTRATPIQYKALEYGLTGVDFIGRAQTGTGKTAAFLLNILTYFVEEGGEGQNSFPRSLILAPTRELVLQIQSDAKKLAKYLKLNICAIYGGVDYDKQINELKAPIDILIATPGRLLDFIAKRYINLSAIEILVLDEADRMLNMGFIDDIKRIIRFTPQKQIRQTLLFSATFTADILKLAQNWTFDAVKVSIKNNLITSPNITQYAFLLAEQDKLKVLKNIILQWNLTKTLVFANRRDKVKNIFKELQKLNYSIGMLSGDIEQSKRIKTLDAFKRDKIQILVATDVAGRGLHIDDISHVINYNLPEEPEDYLHRIGRTARAGMSGTSISFIGEEDAFLVEAIEKLIDKKLDCTNIPTELLTRDI